MESLCFLEVSLGLAFLRFSQMFSRVMGFWAFPNGFLRLWVENLEFLYRELHNYETFKKTTKRKKQYSPDYEGYELNNSDLFVILGFPRMLSKIGGS